MKHIDHVQYLDLVGNKNGPCSEILICSCSGCVFRVGLDMKVSTTSTVKYLGVSAKEKLERRKEQHLLKILQRCIFFVGGEIRFGMLVVVQAFIDPSMDNPFYPSFPWGGS